MSPDYPGNTGVRYYYSNYTGTTVKAPQEFSTGERREEFLDKRRKRERRKRK